MKHTLSNWKIKLSRDQLTLWKLDKLAISIKFESTIEHPNDEKHDVSITAYAGDRSKDQIKIIVWIHLKEEKKNTQYLSRDWNAKGPLK